MAAQEEVGTPKALVQYVRDAQKAGLNLTKIRENALKAGWPEPTVDDAIDSARKAAGTPAVASNPAPAGKDFAAKDARDNASPVEAVTAPKDSASAPVKPAEETATGGVPAGALPAGATPAGATTPNPASTTPATPNDSASPAAAPAGGNPAITKPAEGASRADDYIIGEGDVLHISVWDTPTASVNGAVVRTDGKISMPLIKDIMVAGLTPAQVETMVQEQLSKFVRTPDVAVVVTQINSKKIYLVGAVKREGPLKFSYRMTVLQAISEAGGLTDYAKRKNIYILHNENGRSYKLPFNYDDVLKGEHMEQNILLSPGDTIVVR